MSSPSQPGKRGSSSEDKELKGGIAIPFYVLVLGVIGGAINMTRQIPKYHREGEESVVEIKPLEGLALLARRGSQQEPSTSAANAEGAKLSSSSTPKQAGNSPNPKWREELLNQYMCLASAPFLAMITYFLMAWLGVTTVPALVLISFSVGLITEPVLGKIIEVAQGFLKSGSKPTPPDSGKQQQKDNAQKDSASTPDDPGKAKAATTAT